MPLVMLSWYLVQMVPIKGLLLVYIFFWYLSDLICVDCVILLWTCWCIEFQSRDFHAAFRWKIVTWLFRGINATHRNLQGQKVKTYSVQVLKTYLGAFDARNKILNNNILICIAASVIAFFEKHHKIIFFTIHTLTKLILIPKHFWGPGFVENFMYG